MFAITNHDCCAFKYCRKGFHFISYRNTTLEATTNALYLCHSYDKRRVVNYSSMINWRQFKGIRQLDWIQSRLFRNFKVTKCLQTSANQLTNRENRNSSSFRYNFSPQSAKFQGLWHGRRLQMQRSSVFFWDRLKSFRNRLAISAELNYKISVLRVLKFRDEMSCSIDYLRATKQPLSFDFILIIFSRCVCNCVETK